jgi:hypothetical protein
LCGIEDAGDSTAHSSVPPLYVSQTIIEKKKKERWQIYTLRFSTSNLI